MDKPRVSNSSSVILDLHLPESKMGEKANAPEMLTFKETERSVVERFMLTAISIANSKAFKIKG